MLTIMESLTYLRILKIQVHRQLLNPKHLSTSIRNVSGDITFSRFFM